MALSYTSYTGNGSLTDFPISFDYIDKSHINVTVSGQAVAFTVDSINKVVRLSNAPDNGSRVLVFRKTPITHPYSDFSRGNAFGQANVNNSFLWQLMISQELSEGRHEISHVMLENLNMGGNKVINAMEGEESKDLVTLGQVNRLIQEATDEPLTVWEHLSDWSTNPLVEKSNQLIPYFGTNQTFRPLSLPYQVDSAAHPDPNALLPNPATGYAGELVDVSKYVDEDYTNSNYIRNLDSVSDMKSKVGLVEGQKCSTGGTVWLITSNPTPLAVSGGLYAKALTAVKLSDWGGSLTLAEVQEAQDSSAYSRLHVDVSDIKEISWEGILKIDDWLEWHGAGRFENTIKPSKILRSEIGGDAIIAKRDTTRNLEHFLMQDLGIDLGFSGVFPTLDQLVSMVRITANGSHDTDITYLRCHFANPAHECTVHNVHTTGVGVSSGGTIKGLRMLFCSGDVDDLALASRSSNMFKTIHGTIDLPGSYGEYPISDVVSFGNTCRGMRTLADFKRGTTDFSHNESYVEDMTDVASISVDGVLKGTIGPDNSGKQTPAAANTKNFYEIQGVDLEVLGGDWDCDNQAGAVAGVLVTDYAFPAETTGAYNSNPSVNVNIRTFTGRNIPFHAVRLINTTDCDVRGINAYGCQLDAVSFEYVSGKIDKQGSPVVSKNNSVDEVNSNSCRFQVSATTGAEVKIGEKISNENGLYEIQLVGIPAQPYRSTFEPIELNANPRGENYGTGVPVRWGGSATATVIDSGAPYDSSIYLSIEDVNTSAVQTFGPTQKFAFKQGEPIYFSTVCRLDTSTRCSIVIQEYSAADSYITAGYVPLGATSNFELRKRKYVVQDANTAYVKILLAPAAASGADSSLVGTADFADFKISRKIN